MSAARENGQKSVPKAQHPLGDGQKSESQERSGYLLSILFFALSPNIAMIMSSLVSVHWGLSGVNVFVEYESMLLLPCDA
jgi:hypothetical protein